jgi:hypothetical protein
VRRRAFLGAAGAAAAAAVGVSLAPRAARAFGDPPPGQGGKLLPAQARATGILECFLYGGLSTWESFYCVEEYGRPDDPDPELAGTQYHAFTSPENTALLQALALCGEPPAAPVPFAIDSLGNSVKLGPMVRALAARPDVLARMRVVVNRHELEPHEAAIPLALCGRALGSPTMASLGAHVQRSAIEHDPGARQSPFSYAFATNYLPTDNVRASIATGTHPGSARPLLIKVDGIERLEALLGRGAIGPASARSSHDALVNAYVDQYRARLRFAGKGDPLRAPRLADLAQASRSVENAAAVQAVLDPALFASVETAACGDNNIDVQATSLKLCAHLLTHPTEPARHCCFIDPGLFVADGGGGYDTHVENSLTQTRNLRNSLTQLLAVVNEPGEDDPAKISLDRTMIVLNMEFGRSPQRQGKYGRNHWPYGYVQIYIGGPITPDQAGLHGAIGPDGRATTFTTPAENRIACLLALGIWPFHHDSFGVSDVTDASTEIEGVLAVSERVLGYKL